MTALAAMLLVLVVLIALGVPIAISLALSCLVYYGLADQPFEIVSQRILAGVDSFPLLAIPLFILAGTAMAHGGIASAMMDFADALVGHWRGGLAQVNVFNSLLMGGMSGSSFADASTDAKVLVPIMVKKGYSNEFASALSAASGVIAPIIPPGIGLILYGLIAQVSVGRLFLGALVPGILLAIALSITVAIIARRRKLGSDRTQRLPGREVLRAFLRAFPALGMPILLLIGLRLGYFTPTELGAIAAVYALLVGAFVYRQITWRTLVPLLRDATLANGMVMLILAAGAAFGTVMTIERAPLRLTESLTSLSDNPLVTLLIINLVLLLLGMFLDGATLLIILTPILAVTAAVLGVDPIHFGVVMVVNITLGGITPPMGAVVFTVVGITKANLMRTFRETLPFLGACVAVLVLITYVPELVLWLPGVMMP